MIPTPVPVNPSFPDSTASVDSLSFLTLATAACASFPVNRVMSPAFRTARSQSLRSAVNETSIAMYLASAPSVASITKSAFLKLRWVSPWQTASCHIAQVPGAEGPDELQAHVGSDARGVLDGLGPGEVSLEGAGVALYAAQPGLGIRVPSLLLLDKDLEPDWKLKQFLTQDPGPMASCHDGLASGARRK